MVDKIDIPIFDSYTRYTAGYYFNDGSHLYQPFLKRVLMNNSDSDTFYKVGVDDVGRLDLISNKVYGNSFLWWIIAVYNNIYNPFNLKAGVTLRIPNISKNNTKFFVSERD